MTASDVQQAPNGLGTAAMVTGIVGLVIALIPGIGLVSFLIAPVALVLGIIAVNKPGLAKGGAKIGIFTSAGALLVCVLWLAYFGTRVAADRSADAGASVPMTRYVNDPASDFGPELRAKYVDFSFDYPQGWERALGNGNFVQVSAPKVNGHEPYAVAVSEAEGSGDRQRDNALFQLLVPQMAQQLGSGLDNFQMVSSGPARLGQYESFAMYFSGRSRPVDGTAPAEMVGRIDLIVPPGQTRGVSVWAVASDRSDLRMNARDLGEDGILEEIYSSFRLGAPQAAK